MEETWKNNLNKNNLFSQFCIFSLGHKIQTNNLYKKILAMIMTNRNH